MKQYSNSLVVKDISNVSFDFVVDTTSWRPSTVWHYNDVTMSSIAPQITTLTIVYSTVCSRRRSKKTSRQWPLYGEFTGEFPAQKASNAEIVSIWWRHHGVMTSTGPVFASLYIYIWFEGLIFRTMKTMPIIWLPIHLFLVSPGNPYLWYWHCEMMTPCSTFQCHWMIVNAYIYICIR